MNPHGLHAEEHYSTAYDLAQMTRVAMQHPLFAEMVARKQSGSTAPSKSRMWW